MGAACSKDGAVSLEALASHHNHTITQLSMEALVVELLKNMLEMTRKVHNRIFYLFLFDIVGPIILAPGAALATQQHNEGHC